MRSVLKRGFLPCKGQMAMAEGFHAYTL